MANIEEQTALATSTPKEAAENIEQASIFSIEPAAYKSVKADMQAQVESYKKPTEASDTTKQYMAQSSEHASLAQNDTENMSYLDRQAHLISDYLFDRPTKDRDVIALSLKKMNTPNLFTEQDQIDLDNANFDRQTLAKRNYGLDGPIETLPAKALGMMYSTGHDLLEGALEGLSTDNEGGPPIGILGGVQRHNFQASVGATYNELSHAVDKDGQPRNLDENTKQSIARGVGLASSAIQEVVGFGAMRATPFMNQFMRPAIAKTLVNSPASAALVKTLMTIGEASATGFFAGAGNEAVTILGEQVAQHYDGKTYESLLNSLMLGAEKVTQSKARLAEAGTTGGLAMGGFATAMGAVGFKSTYNRYEKMSEFVQDYRAGTARDVTPEAPLQLHGEGARPVEGVIDVTPPQIGGGDPVNQSVKIIHATEAFDNMGKAMKQMEMGEHSPAERSNFMKMVFDNAGLKRVWIAYGDYVKWREGLDSPENKKKVRDVIDPTGRASENLNAPIPIDAHKFMDLVHDFPDVTSILRVDPKGPTKTQAETYMQNLQAAENKRTEILTKAGVRNASEIPDNGNLDFSGKLNVVHGSPENLDKFVAPKDANKQSRYGGGDDAVFGPETYFDHDGYWTAADGGMEKGGRGIHFKHVYGAEVNFKKALMITPKTLEKVSAMIGDLRGYDEVPEKLKSLGYDGIIIKGLEDHVDKIEKEFRDRQPILVESDKTLGTADDNWWHSASPEEREKWKSLHNQMELFKRLKTGLKFPDEYQDQIISFEPQNNATIKEKLGERGSVTKEQIKKFKEKNPNQAVIDQALNPVKNVGDVAGGIDWHGETLLLTEDEYLNQPTFTKAIEGVLPEKEVKRINEAQLKARTAVAEALKDKANRDLVNRTTDAFEEEMGVIQAEETKRLEVDPQYAVLDKFQRESIANESGRSKHSIYAIDKSLLTDDQLMRYATDPNLEANKVWKKGGLSPDEAAHWMQIPGLTGDKLLESLARPPRKDVIKARTATREQGAMAKAMNTVKFDDTALAKAFSNNTKNHLAEMKYMASKEWSAAKGGIKKIVLPIPTPKELTAKAREAVRTMRYGDLSLTQFKVGERVSQRTAINAILNNEVEKAFMNKEKAALNSEMQKEVARAIKETDKAFRQFARIQSKRSRAMLAEAGSIYENAINEFLDVFKLDPSMHKQSEIGSFQKWAKSQYEKGVGDFAIPESLSDVRQSANDLTVEQILTIAHRMGSIEHLARLKNKLFGKRETERIAGEKADKIATFEAVIDDAVGKLEAHQDYDETRAHVAYHDQPGQAHRFNAAVSTAVSLMDNIKHIAYMMDENKPNGYFYKMFVEGLTGEGEFKDKQGFSGDIEDRKKLLEFHDKVVNETIGRKEYDSLWNTWVDVPEFKELKAYNYGKMRKGELVTLMGQLGDPDGRNNILNAGASLEIVEKVLDNTLTEAHARYVTNFMHMGKEAYWQRTVELEKRMNGQDVTPIEGVPWNFKDKQYPGGYMRQRYQHDMDLHQLEGTEDEISKRTAAIEGNEETGYYAKQRAAETTNQGRIEERKGSKKPLDLTFSNIFTDFAEIITDLNYREPVANNLKLLKNAEMKEALINTVGIQKYRILTNTTMELAGRHEGENANYFQDQTRFMKDLVGDAKSGFSVSRIGANVTSALVQPTSIVINALPKMGPTGPKHLAAVVASVLRRPHLIGQFFDFASTLDTSIKLEHNKMVEDLAQTLHEALPSKNRFPILAPATETFEFLKKTSIGMIQAVDTVSKSFVALSAYRQFMAGEVEGFPIEMVRNMSHEETIQNASKYAAQISDLAMTRGHRVLDQSPLTKSPYMWPFAWFFNDARQTFNSVMSQGRTVKWESVKTYDNFKEGNRQAAMKSARGAAGALLGMIVASSVARYYEDKTRGYDTPFDQDHDLSTMEGLSQAAKDYSLWIMSSPVDVIAGVTPIVRDIKYSAFTMKQNRRDGGVVKVRNPITEIEGAFGTVAKLASEIISMDRGLEDVTDKEMKQIVYAMGYAMGFPTQQIYKGYQWWKKEPDMVVDINQFHTVGTQEKLGPTQELHEEIQKYKKDPPKGASAETIEKMNQFDKKLVEGGHASVPEETNNMIKQLASGGDWKKLDPATGAAGVYQFTPTRWAEISAENPDLGLTENGRVSKDSAQQDRAIEWESNNNARLLAGQGIPVNTESLYAAHMLGIKKALKLYQSSASDELQAAGLEYQNLKTVGQARKQIKKQVNDKRLTLTSTETQD